MSERADDSAAATTKGSTNPWTCRWTKSGATQLSKYFRRESYSRQNRCSAKDSRTKSATALTPPSRSSRLRRISPGAASKRTATSSGCDDFLNFKSCLDACVRERPSRSRKSSSSGSTPFRGRLFDFHPAKFLVNRPSSASFWSSLIAFDRLATAPAASSPPFSVKTAPSDAALGAAAANGSWASFPPAHAAAPRTPAAHASANAKPSLSVCITSNRFSLSLFLPMCLYPLLDQMTMADGAKAAYAANFPNLVTERMRVNHAAASCRLNC